MPEVALLMTVQTEELGCHQQQVQGRRNRVHAVEDYACFLHLASNNASCEQHPEIRGRGLRRLCSTPCGYVTQSTTVLVTSVSEMLFFLICRVRRKMIASCFLPIIIIIIFLS